MMKGEYDTPSRLSIADNLQITGTERFRVRGSQSAFG